MFSQICFKIGDDSEQLLRTVTTRNTKHILV